MDIISVYRIIDLTGVFINGILGGAIARRRKFDAIGSASLLFCLASAAVCSEIRSFNTVSPPH